MKWFRFIISHSIFVAICAAALCYQTYLLLKLPFDHYTAGLVFFATLSSYNFYWILSKYYFSRGISLQRFLAINASNVLLFLFAGAGLLYCISYLPGIIPATGIAVLLTLLYSVPLWRAKMPAIVRKSGFLKTILLALTWTYVTVILPAHNEVLTGNYSLALLFTARFLFMLMLCIIFDSRDIHVDKIHALRSLATDVSPQALRVIITITFSLYIIAGVALRYQFDSNAQMISFFVTGCLTLLVYRMSLRKQGYYFYYFLVDGLMLFSALSTFVATI